MSTIITAMMPDRSTQTLSVDAIVTENGQLAATITEHPVEQGANVSDHIRPEAAKDKYDLVFTNTPFGSPASNYAEQALAKLRLWRETGALLSFSSTTGAVSNRAIESLSWTRDAKSGGTHGPRSLTGGLRISLNLKEIRIVTNKLTKVAISRSPRVPPKTKTGKTPVTPATPAPAPAAPTSGLSSLLGKLRGTTSPAAGVNGALNGGS